MNKYENDWWRQPRREWEEEHWGEPVIPGRPNVDGELPEVTKPATDQDCKEAAQNADILYNVSAETIGHNFAKSKGIEGTDAGALAKLRASSIAIASSKSLHHKIS